VRSLQQERQIRGAQRLVRYLSVFKGACTYAIFTHREGNAHHNGFLFFFFFFCAFFSFVFLFFSPSFSLFLFFFSPSFLSSFFLSFLPFPFLLDLIRTGSLDNRRRSIFLDTSPRLFFFAKRPVGN